jgi:hypothetical protein
LVTHFVLIALEAWLFPETGIELWRKYCSLSGKWIAPAEKSGILHKNARISNHIFVRRVKNE